MSSELLGASWDADEDVVNHACDPTTYLDLSPNQPSLWGLRTTERGLNEGESVTFFYPSTEWDMAQGFNCSCDAAVRLFFRPVHVPS